MFILFKKRIVEISYSWKPIHFPSPVEIGEKGWGDRSVFAIDRSRKWVAESKATDTGRNQPERESLFSLRSFSLQVDASLHHHLSLSPSPPPPFLLRHRHPLLCLLYVSSALRSRFQAPNRSRNICTGSAGGWSGGAGGDWPVRALIRDERVMSLTNKPSRYERFFWIAWRSMSWFLLSPRFDAPSFPRVHSIFTTVQFLSLSCSVLFVIYLFILLLFVPYSIYYPTYYERYICFLFDFNFDGSIEMESLPLTLKMKSKAYQGSGYYFDWKGNTKYADLFDFVKARDTTKVNHWRNYTFLAQFSFPFTNLSPGNESCELIKTLFFFVRINNFIGSNII